MGAALYNIQICFGDVKRGQLLIQTWLNMAKESEKWLGPRSCGMSLWYNVSIVVLYIYICDIL